MDLAKCPNNYWMYCVTIAFVLPVSQNIHLITKLSQHLVDGFTQSLS